MEALERAKAAHAENDATMCVAALAEVVCVAQREASFDELNAIRREFTALCVEYRKHEWIVELLQQAAALGTMKLAGVLLEDGQWGDKFASLSKTMSDVFGQFAFFSAPRLARTLRSLAGDLKTVQADADVARRAVEDAQYLMDTSWHPAALPHRMLAKSFAPVPPPMPMVRKPSKISISNILYFDLKDGATFALFADGDLQVQYSVFGQGLRKINNQRWIAWRDELCGRMFAQWLNTNQAHAQIVVLATINRYGEVEFTIEHAMPTDDFVLPEEAKLKVHSAIESVSALSTQFENSSTAEDDCVSATMRLHFSTAPLYAPKFRTHPDMPLMVHSSLRQDARGRFRGGIVDGFSIENADLARNCNIIRKGTGPIAELWPLTPSSSDDIDSSLKAPADAFLREWTNVTRTTRVGSDELVGAVKSIYNRAGLSNAKIAYCSTWREFADATEPIITRSEIVHNSIRTLLLHDRANLFEQTKQHITPETFNAIHAATIRPANERSDVLFERFMEFVPSTAMQRAQRTAAPRQLFLSVWGPWDTESLGPYAFLHEQSLVPYTGTTLQTWQTLHNEALCALFTDHTAFICARQPVTIQMINEETNVERRRLYLDMFGIASYLQKSNYEVLDHDERYGTLLRRPMRHDEPLVMLRVVNSTVEPDGTRKEYFLRVPPDMVTAKEAVAWTFRMEVREYGPVKET